MTLIATRRSRRRSRASTTTPMPPAPSALYGVAVTERGAKTVEERGHGAVEAVRCGLRGQPPRVASPRARRLVPAPAGRYPGRGATTASGAAVVADRYVWRGVTRVNGWVLQPSGSSKCRPVASRSRSACGQTSSSAGRGRGSRRRGFRPPRLGELDVDVSAGTDAGPLALTAGWVRYTYHGEPAAGSRSAQEHQQALRLGGLA